MAGRPCPGRACSTSGWADAGLRMDGRSALPRSSVLDRGLGRLCVTLLAAQGASDVVAPLEEQATERRDWVGRCDVGVGRVDAVLADSVGVTDLREEQRHVR